jgi:hypothetical protein
MSGTTDSRLTGEVSKPYRVFPGDNQLKLSPVSMEVQAACWRQDTPDFSRSLIARFLRFWVQGVGRINLYSARDQIGP